MPSTQNITPRPPRPPKKRAGKLSGPLPRRASASSNHLAKPEQHERLPLRLTSAPAHLAHASAAGAGAAARHAPPGDRLRHLWMTVFINRNFSRLWWGQTISSIGDYAWDTALVLWVATYVAAGHTWTPLAVSGLILAAALPQILIGPIAGVFVDRWDKRRTIVIMLALQTIIALALVVVAARVPLPIIGTHPLPLFWQLGVIYVDVALLTIGAQFVMPAQLALVKDIVPQPKQDQALEASQAVQGLAVIFGPPIAAAMVFGLGIQWALLLNTLSFLAALGATLAIEAPPSASSLAPGESGHFSREFLAGVVYVLRHGILRTILFAEILAWLGFGALQVLGYFFITRNLRAPASGYGYLASVFGVGAIAGAVLVTVLGQRFGLARVLWIGLIASGVMVIVLSHLTNYYIALGAAFCFGTASTSVIVAAGPLALDATTREFVGRVTAVLNPVGRLAVLVSVALSGYLVSDVLGGFHASVFGITFDPVNVVLSGTGALFVLGGLYALVSLRELRAHGDGGGQSQARAARAGR